MIPNHDTAKHRVVTVLAEISTSDRGIHVATLGSTWATWKTNIKLGIVARGVGEIFLPFGVVETRVRGAISIQESAAWIVVELNPKPVKLHMLKQVLHVLVLIIERALGSGGDDIVSSGHSDQRSQGCDHGRVAFVASCRWVSIWS